MQRPMWADKESDVDYLNFSEVADVAASMIKQPGLLPLSIGIYGGWGAGKSTTLRLIHASLQRGSPKDDTLVIEFDAWLYQDFDDARAALMDVITSRLMEASKDHEGLAEKAKSLIARVDYFRAAGLLADVGMSALIGVPPGILSRAVDGAKKMWSGDSSEGDISDFKQAGADVISTGKSLLKPEEVTSPPREIAAFREEFGSLLSELNVTLVVFIDNLDRCLPKKAIQTLEAVRLFLFLPKTAFVIAADEDMIRHAVREHYAGPDDRLVTDYLDKMVQVSLRVPRVGVQETKAYLMLLFAEAAGAEVEKLQQLREGLIEILRSLWKGEPITPKIARGLLGASESSDIANDLEMADRLAHVLATAPNIQGNPRIVKRLLNTVRIRTVIAQQRGMNLDEALIAKLAVLERCTNDPAFSSFCQMVALSTNGAPHEIAAMEEVVDDPAAFEEACPEALSNYSSFLREWCKIPPDLAGRDLRPAIYLSRDAAPVSLAAKRLSAEATSLFETLASAPSLTSAASKNAAKDVSQEDAPAIMTALISELRRIDNWEKRPKEFTGALLLADQHSPVQQPLSQFVASLKIKPVPAWLMQVCRQRLWMQNGSSA